MNFNEFQQNITECIIKIRNSNLLHVVEKFSFHKIVTDDQNSVTRHILNKKIEQEIIVIRNYIPPKKDKIFKNTFVIVYDYNVILYQSNQLSEIYTFFKSNQNSIVYCIQKEVENLIKDSNQIKNLPYFDFNIPKIYAQLSKEFLIMFLKNVTEDMKENIKKYWKTIIDSISLFLIKIAYKNSKIDRFTNFNYILNNKNIDEYYYENDFVKLEDINIGSSGIIGLYYFIKKEIICVIKTFIKNKDSKSLFTREKQNYLSIHHPLIPKYYGTVIDMNDGNCIIIEYIEGESLANMKNKNLSKEDYMKIILEILFIIEYIHLNGFVYRDIKPNNFILDKNKTVYLIDFDRMIKNPSLFENNSNDEFTRDFGSYYFDPKITTSNKYSNEVDIYSINKLFLYDFPKEFHDQLEEEFAKILSIPYNNNNISAKLPISILIDKFFDYYFSKILEINEVDIIKSNINIHCDYFWFYLFLILEHQNPISLYNLGLIYEYGILIWKDNNMNIHYDLMPEFKDMPNNIIPNFKDDEVFDNNIDKFIHNLSLSTIYRKNDFHINYREIKYSQYIGWNIKKAIKYYNLAAEKNHPKAQFILGHFFLNGRYIQKNYNTAFEFFFKAANNKIPEAQYQVGRFYYLKQYNKFDFNKAIFYISQSAEQNYPEALNLLGLIYYEGKYVPRNISKAINLYMKAADQNISFSIVILYNLYYKGLPISYNKIMHYFDFMPKDDIYAKDLFYILLKQKDENFFDQIFIPFLKQTSELNYPHSQYALGYYFYIGYKTPKNINKAISLFLLSAEQNYGKSFHLLGIIHYDNLNIRQDIDKAIYYFKMAIRLKYPDSAYYLGNIYSEGIYVKKDIQKAIYYHSLASDLFFAASQYKLGVIYSSINKISESIYYFSQAANQNHIDSIYSIGVIYMIFYKDFEKSIQYFKRAANYNHKSSKNILELISDLNDFKYDDLIFFSIIVLNALQKNDANSQIYIGLKYWQGDLLKRNIKKSIYYFQLAANQNCAQAQSYLGEVYYELGDFKNSITYLNFAANQNHAISIYNLFSLYYAQKDFEKAIYYLKKSAKLKLPIALHNLGSIYLEGNIVPKDVNLGIYYLTLAANLNYSKSQYDLAIQYYHGKCIKKDIEKAMYYFQILAKENQPGALNYLGLIYKYHLKRKEKEYLMYFHEAAIRNDVDAMLNLANYYIYESGIKNDVNKAIDYLKRASNLGNSKSQFMLASIYYNGKYGIKKDIQKGINFYLLSADNRYPKSQFVVGYLYHKGENLKRNIKKSIHYYKEASNKNNSFAKNNLGILYKYGFGNEVLPNLNLAIEYFTDVIKLKNVVALYNLVHLYFFMKPIKNSLNKSVDILLEQPSFDFEPLNIILCLALIKKFGVNFEKIKNEIIRKSPKRSNDIIKTVFQFINEKKLYIDIIYHLYYKKLQLMDFLYNENLEIHVSADLKTIDDQKKENMKINNISNLFYEGFGHDLIKKPK